MPSSEDRVLDDLRAGLAGFADLAPTHLDLEKVRREGRSRRRRRTLVMGAPALLVVAVATGVVAAEDRGAPASLRVAASPGATVRTIQPRPTLDALPSTAPPAVGELDLPQSGSPKAITGAGWSLDLSQGSGRGAASIEVDDSVGRGHSSAFVISEVYGAAKPRTVALSDALTEADFTENGLRHVVVSGAVPRGISGVGVLDAEGVRGWATLIDPGPAFDTLVFAYETPNHAAVTAVQSVAGSGHVSATEAAPLPSQLPTPGPTPSQVLRTTGEPVVVGGLTLPPVPAGLTLGTGFCNTETATTACWAGTISDPAARAAARQNYDLDTTGLVVNVTPGSAPGLAGAPGSTTHVIAGVTVTELPSNAFDFLSFDLPSGRAVAIEGTNLPSQELLAFAAGIID